MIDKIVPRELNSDIDQRLAPEGIMIDAVNVLYGEDGSNTDGVLKNVRGNTAVDPATSADMVANNSDVRVIGSVADDQRNYIYWFVCGDGNQEDAIYRHNTITNEYETVFANSEVLGFANNTLVVADVVNGYFGSGSELQTIIYFTDNVNPPRKINVDRQLSSNYLSGGRVSEAIQVIKGAPLGFCTARFITDQSVKVNNFQNSAFQFATQYIYVDGEESAISSYSDIYISRSSAVKNLEDFSVHPIVDNVMEITLNVDLQQPDLDRIRLIARDGNNGAWFVVDEFEGSQNKTVNVGGTEIDVFDAASRTYTFYNDSLSSAVSTDELNKLYDNVPFTARAQTVVGNRLVYANYTEGRPNNNISDVGNRQTVSNPNNIYKGKPSFSVEFSDADASESDLIGATSPETNIVEDVTTTTRKITIDVPNLLGGATTIKGGTNVNVSIEYRPTGSVNNGLNLIGRKREGTVYYDITLRTASTDLSTIDTDYANEAFVTSFSVGTDLTVSEFTDLLKEQLSNKTCLVRYDLGGTIDFDIYEGGSDTGDNIDMNALSGQSILLDVNYKIPSSAITIGVSNVITITPQAEAYFAFGDFAYLMDDFSLVDIDQVTVDEDDQALDSVNSHGTWDTGSTWLGTVDASASIYGLVKGFKSGSFHKFGVVYYDEFNRSGFVNELGKVYVPFLSEERSGASSTGLTNRGPASIRINWNEYAPPSWATRYQIVYSGRDSVGDFMQYAVAKAYRKNEEAATSPGEYTDTKDANDKRLYISLKTLDLYQADKSTSREYSFTKGDKMRIISHRGSDPTVRAWPRASDGSVIEFDVVDVVSLSTAGLTSIIDDNMSDNNTDNEYIGTFVVIESPQVSAGVGDLNDGTPLQYEGWDWYDVSGEDHPGETGNTIYSLWGKESIVEIYSPKKRVSADVYYEIGHGRETQFHATQTHISSGLIITTSNGHGAGDDDTILLTNGDIHYRNVPVKTPWYDNSLSAGQEWQLAKPHKWKYVSIPLECATYNEIVQTEDWSKGRPHGVLPSANTKREENGITYSEGWEQTSSILTLSSFNPSLANFDNYERKYGAINFLGSVNADNLLAIQESKFSITPINASIIQQSDGGSIAALSTQFINRPNYKSEDFGCGNNPESVVIGEGMVFFIDPEREKVVQYIGGQLVPISDKGIVADFIGQMQQFNQSNGWNRLLCGIEPENNLAYITIRYGTWNNPGGRTWAYDYARRVWASRYSFIPDKYERVAKTMYTGRYYDDNAAVADDQDIFWEHGGNTYNTFYNEIGASTFTVVSKSNPSMVKSFNALSYEGDDNGWDASMQTSLGQQVNALKSGAFEEIEGGYYSSLERDSSANSTSHVVGIGTVASSSGTEITFKNKVSYLNIPSNSEIRIISGGEFLTIGSDVQFSSFTGPKKMVVTNTPTVSEDDVLVAIGTNVLDGDHPRGHYASITMTNTATNQVELFCVNAHIRESKHNHRMGQQQ